MGVALDARFGELVEALQERGGDVLFFGGDALFAWFTGDHHEWRAARAAVDLQRLVRRAPALTVPGGSVRLRMSLGVHSGTATAVIGGERQRSFFLVGPTVDRVLALEADADAGRVLTSPTTARALNRRSVEPRGSVVEVKARLPEPPEPPPPRQESIHGADRFLPPSLRPLLAADTAPREHRLITVAFARLGGLARLEPNERAERVRRWCGDLDEVTEATGTTLLATDVRRGAVKATLVAGIPSQSDRDEERAVAAAYELVSRDRFVAAGVNTGAAFAGDVGHSSRRTYMILGDSVNTAARAMGAARLGEVLITDGVARTVRARTSGRRRRVHAKGKREPLMLASVLDISTNRAEAAEPPFVGRGRELAVLVSALESDNGFVVEIVADGGLGRTRLADEAVKRAPREPVVRIDVPASVGGAPFAPLHAAMRALTGVRGESDLRSVSRVLPDDLRPELPLLDPVMGFDRRGEALVRSPEVALRERAEMIAACAGERRGALLVDDADALDPASGALLQALVPRLARLGWVVLATRRPASRSLAGSARTLRLGPLPESAIRRVVLATLDAPVSERHLRQLVERAGGNPLFATELAETAVSDPTDLPRAAQRLGGALIDTLPGPDRTLVRSAAAMGDGVDLSLLATVIGDPSVAAPERWKGLQRFVSVGDDGRISFASDTIRLAAYEGLPYRDRRQLHARGFEALELRRSAGDPVPASALTRHAELAGLTDATARWAPIAARDAESAGAVEDAASLWALALSAGTTVHLPGAELARLAEAYGDASELLGESDAARAAYRRAVRGAKPLDAARLAWKLGRVDLRGGDLHPARLAADRGLRALRRAGYDGPDPLAVRLLLLRAAAHCFSDRREPSLRDGEAAMEMAFALEDDQLVGDAAIHLEMEYGERGDARQEALGAIAVELLAPAGPTVELGSVLGSMGLARMFAGDWVEALELYERAARVFELCGHVVGQLAIQINRLGIVVEQGHLDETLETIDDLAPATTSAPRWFSDFLLATRGRVEAFNGEPDAGARTIRAALRSLRAEAPERIVADTECYLLEALVLGGKSVPAARLGRTLVVTLDRVAPDQVVAISARRLLALAHYQSGTGDPFAELDAALSLARKHNALIEVGRILGEQSAILAARGERPRRAWERERHKILADHDVVFEPTFPLKART